MIPITEQEVLEALKEKKLISVEGELHGTAVLTLSEIADAATLILQRKLGIPAAWRRVEWGTDKWIYTEEIPTEEIAWQTLYTLTPTPEKG
jgi:hypothetical protein